MVLPDYQGGGIVNLMSSLAAGLGAEPGPYPPLGLLPSETVVGAANVVLFVIDGLGHAWLERFGAGGALAAHLQGRITSVFPSTTAAAVTSFLTGTAPQQHAMTGWFMYLKELGTVSAILPFRARWGGAPFTREGVDAAALIGAASLFDRLTAQGYFVIEERLADSAFSRTLAGCAVRVGYRDLEDCFAGIERIVRSGPGRKYIHAYWPEMDALSHVHGPRSDEVMRHFRELDRAFGELLERLRGTGTLVIVTADHGFVDADPQRTLWLDEHPDLAACLLVPLCGEPRAAYCYLRPGCEERFTGYVAEHFAGHCTLHPAAEVLAQGWFGQGEPDPRLHGRIGDYVLVMKDGTIIKDSVLGEKPFRHVGVHGGVSADEMYVPFIVARP